MSKRKLVASLAVGLALIAAGWWAAKIFWLTPPPAYSAQMIAYGVAQQVAGGPAIALRLGDGGRALGANQMKGPVPVSMPAPPYLPLAKKNKVKGDVEVLLDVDARGSVAGIREMYSRSVGGSVGAELAESVSRTAQNWKFEPAMEKGEPVAATVIVQVSF